ncbi:MAG: glutamine synthetase [Bacteroidetes bacterium]|nr:glutamine synthetase [Bacteroidota bacterium]
MDDKIKLSPHALVTALNKPASSFTKEDLIRYIEEQDIRMLNFRYPAEDGRLKTLSFIISSRWHLDRVLSAGERVDGSSLFPDYVEAGASDLYVIPRYSSAFRNPFAEIPSLDILCSYYDKDGAPFANAPDHILRKAHESLRKVTGMDFEVMGELEYYVISERRSLFEAFDQRGYHESYPFAKWEALRNQAMYAIAACGGSIKYGHSEVGNFKEGGLDYEQNEIEFVPAALENAADQLIVAKWILRSLAYNHRVALTFAPKITTGKAGSGMHIHTRLVQGGKNMFTSNGTLTDTAKKAIAGYLSLAPSLTAFGNTIPTSYFRLVPNMEAPTTICWGDRNRKALVRVPLGWQGKSDMIFQANPNEPRWPLDDFSNRQTIEFRSPDGSADIYLLLAGLTVAARYGFEMKDALEFAKRNYVDIGNKQDCTGQGASHYNQLPASCWDSADCLKEQRTIYEQMNVFPPQIIDGIIRKLQKYNDQHLRVSLIENEKEMMKVVNTYIHCG